MDRTERMPKRTNHTTHSQRHLWPRKRKRPSRQVSSIAVMTSQRRVDNFSNPARRKDSTSLVSSRMGQAASSNCLMWKRAGSRNLYSSCRDPKKQEATQGPSVWHPTMGIMSQPGQRCKVPAPPGQWFRLQLDVPGRDELRGALGSTRGNPAITARNTKFCREVIFAPDSLSCNGRICPDERHAGRRSDLAQEEKGQ
jgi:hypothetical protein